MSENLPEWTYKGATGPEHWGELHEDFRMCRTGEHQSPIDLADTEQIEEPPPVEVLDNRLQVEARNDRTTVKVSSFSTVSTLRGKQRPMSLKEFHFHTPSEHTLQGKRFPMEAHFVHGDFSGNLVVVGLFLKAGEPNDAWGAVQDRVSEPWGSPFEVLLKDLLPESSPCFIYEGSLTTPPCSEGIQWIVYETAVDVDSDWIEAFRDRYGPNHRPIQPLNERTVMHYVS